MSLCPYDIPANILRWEETGFSSGLDIAQCAKEHEEGRLFLRKSNPQYRDLWHECQAKFSDGIL